MTDIPGTTDATFGRFNIFSDQLKILKAEIKEEEKRSTNLFSIYIFLCFLCFECETKKT